ncbi:hypothetical protein FOCC_FOCC001024, partial [Frankliniella occidentalis]
KRVAQYGNTTVLVPLVLQEVAVPAEHVAPSPLRLVHPARVPAAAQVGPVCGRHRAALGPAGEGRRQRVRRPLRELGVQADNEPLAVLHHGQLLVDPDGRPVPAQPHIPGALLRHLLHQAVRRAGMGSALNIRPRLGHRQDIRGERPLLDDQQQPRHISACPSSDHRLHSRLCYLHRCGKTMQWSADSTEVNFFLFLNIIRMLMKKLQASICDETRRHRYSLTLKALGQIHPCADAAVWGSLLHLPGHVLRRAHGRKVARGRARRGRLAVSGPGLRLIPGIFRGRAVLLHEWGGPRRAGQGVEQSAAAVGGAPRRLLVQVAAHAAPLAPLVRHLLQLRQPSGAVGDTQAQRGPQHGHEHHGPAQRDVRQPVRQQHRVAAPGGGPAQRDHGQRPSLKSFVLTSLPYYR